MDGVTAGLLIGAALGLGKSILFDAPAQRKQTMLAAKTQELSPWTKMQASAPPPVDYLGSALQGGLIGGQFGQAQQSAAMQQQMLNSQRSLLDAQAAALARGQQLNPALYQAQPYGMSVGQSSFPVGMPSVPGLPENFSLGRSTLASPQYFTPR